VSSVCVAEDTELTYAGHAMGRLALAKADEEGLHVGTRRKARAMQAGRYQRW